MTYRELLLELKFDENIEKAIIDCIENHETEIKELSRTAYEKTEDVFTLCTKDPFTRLVVITYLLVQAYDVYKANNIPDSIIFDTFRDVSLRCNLHYRRTNEMAVSKEEVEWYQHLYKGNIFKLGCMQFEKTQMVYLNGRRMEPSDLETINHYKMILPEGTPVLSCHIQEGEDLSDASIEQSFQFADEFFKNYFPQIKFHAYVCYTWLLYPKMIMHLKENSKIKKFAKRFQVICSYDSRKLAMKILFPTGDKRGTLPLTSLQKMAIEHEEWFGFSCGVILRESRL